MTGLGIIDTDLCLWAGTLTAADIEMAGTSPGHPVIKAKPGPIEAFSSLSAGPFGLGGLICQLNTWVNSNPVLAGVLVAAGYLTLRKK